MDRCLMQMQTRAAEVACSCHGLDMAAVILHGLKGYALTSLHRSR